MPVAVAATTGKDAATTGAVVAMKGNEAATNVEAPARAREAAQTRVMQLGRLEMCR